MQAIIDKMPGRAALLDADPHVSHIAVARYMQSYQGSESNGGRAAA